MWEIYDLETYINQFLYCAFNIVTSEMITFEVSKEVDDRIRMYEHLSKVTHQVGYNNKGFDYPIIDYILTNKKKLLLVKAEDFAWMIHDKANELISENEYFKGTYKIKQLDLFKLHHFDRSKISLKYVAFGLKMKNLIDLPVKPNMMLSSEEMDKIRRYVVNDVLVTKALFDYSNALLKMRKRSTLELGQDCSSMSNTAVAWNGFIKKYCAKTNLPKYVVKNLSTDHYYLTMRDVINPMVSFKTERYQKLLSNMLADETNIVDTDFEYRFECNTIVCDIKKGGLHSLHGSEYFTNQNNLLTDFDFTSYYPYLLLAMGIAPAHLQKDVFLEIVHGMIMDKVNYKAAGDQIGVDNAKISVNSIYGLLNAEGSPMKDVKVLYQVTVNGQLFLLMLTEQLEMIEGVKVKYQNTDGIMAEYPPHLTEQVNKVMDDFAKFIKIPLEAVPMKAVYLHNVSSYIAITESGKVKRKGAFKKDTDKELKDDSSANIIAIALEQYFINGVPVRKTIENHQNMFDFYIGMKKNHGQVYRYSRLENGVHKTEDYHDKVIRFYVTKGTSVITKLYGSEKTQSIIKGYNVKMAQNHDETKPIKDYDINYNYYIHKTNEIIDNIFLSDSQIIF